MCGMGVWQSVASPGSGVHAVPADPDILISGAGIAGLALASKLEQLGFKSVWILEADDCLESRAQGYSLTIQQPGQKALKRLCPHQSKKCSSPILNFEFLSEPVVCSLVESGVLGFWMR